MDNVVYHDFKKDAANKFYIGSKTRKIKNSNWEITENNKEKYVTGVIPIYHHPSVSISSIFYNYDINWKLISDNEHIFPLVKVLAEPHEIERWLVGNNYEEKIEDIMNFTVYK